MILRMTSMLPSIPLEKRGFLRRMEFMEGTGLDTIVRELKAHVGGTKPTGFKTDPHRTAPRKVTRAGIGAIEAIFRFETSVGRGSGVLRLTSDVNDGNTLKAWTLLTALDEVKGFEEQVGSLRPSVLVQKFALL